MKAKHITGRVARKLPVTKDYIHLSELKNTVRLQRDEIIGLKESVERLEKRNEEWALEVQELRGPAKTLKIVWPVLEEDIIAANWTKKISLPKRAKTKPPFIINWVVPPMGPVSGGHADIFRTIKYLESKGHNCNVYFYDAQKLSSLEEIKKNLKNYSPIKAKLFYNAKNISDCDAIFATNWHTAYPVFNYKGNAKKYYFVQDFEPYFDPLGTYSTLAENTYRFNFQAVTLGKWLSQKLSKEYAMKCDHIELGVNPKEYYLSNTKSRKEVLFYARPVTPRRGFEMGVSALELFHKEHPDYKIHFVGWDITPYHIPFPYVNHGILSPPLLNKLYNQCAAGLVLSFTNMSLLPLELMASGCRPVVNDSEHTRMASYAQEIQYALSNPRALADSIFKALNQSSEATIKKMSAFTKNFEWDNSNEKVNDILIRDISSN